MSANEYLEGMLAEILRGVQKEESLFTNEPGFDEAWDELVSGGGNMVPGEIE